MQDEVDLKQLIRAYGNNKVTENLRFIYQDPLTNEFVNSQKMNLTSFEKINDMEILIPSSEQFCPESFLKVLHLDTSLKDFETYIQRLKSVLRANSMNQDLKRQLVKNNFETYFEAKKVFDACEKKLVEENQYYYPLIEEISEEMSRVKTEAKVQYLELSQIQEQMHLQLQTEQILRKVEMLIAVSNDMTLYLANPLLFSYSE